MRGHPLIWCLICCLAILPVGLAGPAAAFEPTKRYQTLRINGWTVHVAPGFAQFPRERKILLDKITRQTAALSARLSRKHLRVMRKADLWLEPGNHYRVLARYHGSKTDIFQEELNPAKYRDVEFYGTFAKVRQPTLVLHELAHVYHDRRLNFQDNRLKRLFARFERSHGKARDRCGAPKRAYALTNDHEFFATFTEAYFAKSCSYPYDRASIRRHHPEMFALLTKVWGP